jgi:hypothetical protein
MEPRVAAIPPSVQDATDPFREAVVGQRTPQVSGLLGAAHEAAREMLEAEDALHLVRQRFEQAEDDPETQGELASEALEQVERQLGLTRARRQQLDSIEGKLWARRNRLEHFLIHTRGRAWWRARHRQLQAG